MSKLTKLSALVAIAAVAGITGCAQGTPGGGVGSDAEEINVTVATVFAKGGWESAALDSYAERVTEASDGRITFDVHYSESLVKAAEIPGALQDGLVDLAVVYPVYTPALFPISNWIAKLGFVGEESHLEGYLATAAAQNDWALNEDLILDEFAAQGIHVVANMLNVPAFDLFCREEPATTLDAVEGLRVRVGGEAYAAEATHLGMEPVQLTGAEMYEGFQRGVVDCAMLHPGVYVDSGLWEIGKYHIGVKLTGWNQYYLTLGETFWADLPEWAQEIFEESAPYWMEQVATNYSGKAQTFFTEAGPKHGVEFLEPEADLENALRDYHQSLLDGGLAEVAPSVIDEATAAGIIERRLESQEAWQKLIDDAGLELGTEKTWREWVDAFGTDRADLTDWHTMLQENWPTK